MTPRIRGDRDPQSGHRPEYQTIEAWTRRRQRRLAAYLVATAFAAFVAGLVAWAWTDVWMSVVTGAASSLVLVAYAAAAAPESSRSNRERNDEKIING